MPYTDVLQSSFWVRVAKLMSLHDEIKLRNTEARCSAGYQYSVHAIAAEYVEVVELLRKDLSPPDVESYSFGDLKGCWEGPQHRWCIRREKDNVILARGLPNRSELIRRCTLTNSLRGTHHGGPHAKHAAQRLEGPAVEAASKGGAAVDQAARLLVTADAVRRFWIDLRPYRAPASEAS